MTYTHDEIREMLRKATPGPWYDHGWDVMTGPHIVAEVLFKDKEHCRGQADLPRTPDDSAFLAASRSIVEQLLAENTRLLEENEALKRDFEVSQKRADELQKQFEIAREVAISIDRIACEREGYDWPANATDVDAEIAKRREDIERRRGKG